MGGSDSCEVQHYHHYTTVYETSPEVKKELDDTKAQLAIVEEEAMKQGDPTLYDVNSNKLLDNFIEKIPTLELSDFIKKETGSEHIGMMGPISSGKTTLLNTMYGLNLEVALGHCTKKCEVVHVHNRKYLWDVAGSDSDYRFYKAENLAFVKDLDKPIILFDNDIASVINIIKIVHKLNPNVILVRTKVDQHNKSNTRTIAEERVLDKNRLYELLGHHLPIYYISSHNVTSGLEKYDWDLFRAAIDA